MIDIIVSTINEGIYNAAKINFPDNCNVIIIHQIVNEDKNDFYKNEYKKLFSDDIKVIQQNNKGLSRNRNNALRNSTSKLIYLADDDIVFLPDFYKTVIEAIQKYPSTDIYTFKLESENEQPYKNYRRHDFTHNVYSARKVSSAEMILKKQWWNQSNLLFDEQFGLGSTYKTGEEYIFLSEANRKKASIQFVDQFIAKHPAQSSGNSFTGELIFAKGALFARVHGYHFIWMNFLFSIKKFNKYKLQHNIFKFLIIIYKGSINFMKYG